jgi:biopolymer transport protein TolQ
MEVQVGEVATQAEQFGLLHLFWIASPVVKIVMIGLIVASIICWAIVIEKYVALRNMQRSTDKFEQMFWSGQSLEDLYLTLGPRNNKGMATLFMAAMREWKRSQQSAMRAGFQGVQMRINKVMDVQIQKEMSQLEQRLLILATVGSTAPFIGLFGTVWGIMNSFRAIGISKNTNLAVVAPGLAEALFATALGLIAAIPAVMFYNKFSSDIGKVAARLGLCPDERDQRYAVRGRDAGAADRVHGGGAVAQCIGADRPARYQGRADAGREGRPDHHYCGRGRQGLYRRWRGNAGHTGVKIDRHCTVTAI